MGPWTTLILAGLLEVGWAVGLKYTNGFTRLWPSVWTVTASIGSVVLLAIAQKNLPLGTAYSVWVGIGTIGAVTMGVILFGESLSAPRLLFLSLIIAGIVGLKATTTPDAVAPPVVNEQN